MSPSAKRACEIPPPVSRIPTQPDIEMGTVPLPVPEDAMEVDFAAGVEPALAQRESVRCGRNVLVKPTWKYVQTLLVSTATLTQRRHEYEKSSMQTVISTTMSHRAKRDEAQLRVVTHEYVDAMRVPEHYASTLRTRTLQSVISRVMSKCRTRQLESCETLFAFFHAWLERDVQMKSPKDSRLRDGWRWQLARAFFPMNPGVSTQPPPGGVHTGTDVRYVENLASLSEVKGLKSSS